jgi:hypothetical protein
LSTLLENALAFLEKYVPVFIVQYFEKKRPWALLSSSWKSGPIDTSLLLKSWWDAP